MSRDHRKLEAFTVGDRFAFRVYELTRSFPREELFGVTSQVRRAALSAPTNIVEGCGRRTDAEFKHFLAIALASLREADYLIDFSARLGYLPESSASELRELADHAARLTSRLIQAVKQPPTSGA